ncbi:tumor necrosis factor beta [Takifugu rubripes]|uniref:Tumor necrosis factor beta n=2 Tax=Takifugu rubripes TaxID=31033 RepID=Q4W899_TAKRU|nr:tumor necrosis factor beta [Takifugu rubripes]BAD98729.1 tumor necrosis factor beta [Takifugu rubripes]|eukprot:NP_001033075.1 tumor necrosis factor beta [Takifugu rubripes]
MECNLTSSHKHLLLHVWCGLLTVAMLVMAALLISIKSKSTEEDVSSLRPSISPTVNAITATLKSTGSSLSYIQLTKSPDNRSWQEFHSGGSCSFVHHEGSIHCRKNSLYFLYAQVAFTKHASQTRSKSVILVRNPADDKSLRKLAEGTFPPTTEGSVWVANVVRLKEDDTISINITGEVLSDITLWGAFELQSC